MKSMHFGIGFMVGFAALTAGSAAFAQTATAQTTSTTTTTTTTPVAEPATAQPAPTQTGMTLPGATRDPAADATDHQGVVGHFGVGFMGTRGLALGAAGAAVDAPVIGLRYWLDDRMGIDAGLGLRFSGGSDPTPSYNIAIVHFGVPLALAGSKHFSFQVVPEANLGYGTAKVGAGPTTKDFHLDLGARAGAEIQFGFIGIPELALQGGIGVGLNYDHFSTAGQGAHTLAFGTSVGDTPWQIFTGNIAALYYFD
ncbi:MAG: hypothetical protein ABUL62_27650 [Myxococcales bacterium]|jgi:hypothetical protein